MRWWHIHFFQFRPKRLRWHADECNNCHLHLLALYTRVRECCISGWNWSNKHLWWRRSDKFLCANWILESEELRWLSRESTCATLFDRFTRSDQPYMVAIRNHVRRNSISEPSQSNAEPWKVVWHYVYSNCLLLTASRIVRHLQTSNTKWHVDSISVLQCYLPWHLWSPRFSFGNERRRWISCIMYQRVQWHFSFAWWQYSVLVARRKA